jgi:hypothetical protein
MTKKKNARPIWLFIVYVFCCCLIFEGTARLYLSMRYHISPLAPGRSIAVIYPELFPTADHRITRDDDIIDILLLGASVINYRISDIDRRLAEALQDQLGQKVRVFNLSKFAHSSRDSLIKYQFLKDKYFDLVLLYHGINEVRANNISADLFKKDYSHCAFYERINTLQQHKELAYVVLPWLVHDLWLNMKHRLFPDNYLPLQKPKPDWLEYGADLKSPVSLQENLTELLRLAAQKKDPVALLTFAYYLPQGYTQQKFEAGLLDYTPDDQAVPVEIWGHAQHVVAGLEAHNAVIRDLKDGPGQIIFIDQAQAIPAAGEYFVDICHFSAQGNQLFVNNLLPPLVNALGSKPDQP